MADIVKFPNSLPTIDELITFLQEMKEDPNPLVGVAVLFELADKRVESTIVNMSSSTLALGAIMLQQEALDIAAGDD